MSPFIAGAIAASILWIAMLATVVLVVRGLVFKWVKAKVFDFLSDPIGKATISAFGGVAESMSQIAAMAPPANVCPFCGCKVGETHAEQCLFVQGSRDRIEPPPE